MAELAALVLAIAIVWTGFSGLSWYAVLGLAVLGTLVYFWMRSTSTIGMFQRVGVVQYTAMTYATQVLTSAILFAIGRGLGSIF
ncbi:hypothetical protein NKI50_01900 [Mesorhizobium sp. M0563]|uniref:hypothetical protein n=1 Tax=Mesorhizobium sp. M0563 TaxID=2956959 RepID=UPI00333A1FC5